MARAPVAPPREYVVLILGDYGELRQRVGGRGCLSVENSRGYAVTARPSKLREVDRHQSRAGTELPLTRHVAGQSAGKTALDPHLAGPGFVIPASRLPWPSSQLPPIYTKPASFINNLRKRTTAPQDKMASSGQQYYELYRRSRYIALHRTLLNLHRKG